MGLVMLVACSGVARAAEPEAASVQAMSIERERIAVERQAADARLSSEEAECRQRFAVTGCLDEARSRHRSVQAALRDRELALDDLQRRQRAAARLQAIAERQATPAVVPAPPVEPVVRNPTPPAGAASDSVPTAAALPASSTGTARPPDPSSARDAALRASAAQARQAQADALQARIAAREAERAARGKPSAPLPLPPELQASAPSR